MICTFTVPVVYNRSMNDDQFMKLFRYIEDFRKETNEKFDQMATKDDLNHLMPDL